MDKDPTVSFAKGRKAVSRTLAKLQIPALTLIRPGRFIKDLSQTSPANPAGMWESLWSLRRKRSCWLSRVMFVHFHAEGRSPKEDRRNRADRVGGKNGRAGFENMSTDAIWARHRNRINTGQNFPNLLRAKTTQTELYLPHQGKRTQRELSLPPQGKRTQSPIDSGYVRVQCRQNWMG